MVLHPDVVLRAIKTLLFLPLGKHQGESGSLYNLAYELKVPSIHNKRNKAVLIVSILEHQLTANAHKNGNRIDLLQPVYGLQNRATNMEGLSYIPKAMQSRAKKFVNSGAQTEEDQFLSSKSTWWTPW